MHIHRLELTILCSSNTSSIRILSSGTTWGEGEEKEGREKGAREEEEGEKARGEEGEGRGKRGRGEGGRGGKKEREAEKGEERVRKREETW